MSYVERHTVEVETATGGGAVGYTPPVRGRVTSIVYTKATGSPYASTADFAIVGEDSGLGLWTESNVNASKTVSPTQQAHDQVGATETDPTRVPVFLANERVQITIAQGGNTKIGSFQVIVA